MFYSVNRCTDGPLASCASGQSTSIVMSADHITACAYNQDIDKQLARIWSGYAIDHYEVAFSFSH